MYRNQLLENCLKFVVPPSLQQGKQQQGASGWGGRGRQSIPLSLICMPSPIAPVPPATCPDLEMLLTLSPALQGAAVNSSLAGNKRQRCSGSLFQSLLPVISGDWQQRGGGDQGVEPGRKNLSTTSTTLAKSGSLHSYSLQRGTVAGQEQLWGSLCTQISWGHHRSPMLPARVVPHSTLR